MAKFGSWRNGFIEIAGVDLSDHCREFSVSGSMDKLANDTHGGSTQEITPGLEDWTVKGKMLQDFAAGSVHATLNAAFKNRTLVAIRWRASSAATSTTNPMYSGAGYVTEYVGFQGAHGDNLEANFTVSPGIGTSPVEYLT